MSTSNTAWYEAMEGGAAGISQGGESFRYTLKAHLSDFRPSWKDEQGTGRQEARECLHSLQHNGRKPGFQGIRKKPTGPQGFG